MYTLCDEALPLILAGRPYGVVWIISQPCFTLSFPSYKTLVKMGWTKVRRHIYFLNTFNTNTILRIVTE